MSARETKHSIFYVLQSPAKGQYKIGVTDDFDSRFKSLCNANGETLAQVFAISCRFADQLESLAHGLFFPQWTGHGEWFHLDRLQVQVLYWLVHGLFLNPDSRRFLEEDHSFYYWENHRLLEAWNIETVGVNKINTEDVEV